MTQKETPWWKDAVFYQIYPRSFNDSNGDGIGDLNGIIEKIPYLKELGIDAVWLCPVNKSPNDDNGYDISDYYDIMDEFGTLDDMKKLVETFHSYGIKIIVDLVFNHTSDEHEWFVDARSSKSSKYRDYYIWKKSDNRPPNNWASFFSGSVWELTEETNEYYLHLFSRKQPDLNWENEKVREEIKKVILWWMDFGADGFRLDAINLIDKNQSFKNTKHVFEGNTLGFPRELVFNQPKVHLYLQELYRDTFSKGDVVTIGECGLTDTDETLQYVAPDRNELSMIITFDHLNAGVDLANGRFAIKEFDLLLFKQKITEWQLNLHGKGWQALYTNNHDWPRALSSWCDDGKYRRYAAKVLATLILTLEGTPFIYQGEEFGMTNCDYTRISQFRDVEVVNFFNEKIEQGMNESEVLEILVKGSRDNSRTPMQWDSSQNAGFTTGTPWIDINSNYTTVNATEEMNHIESIFQFYKYMIQFRKSNPVLTFGKYELLLPEDRQIFAYKRIGESEEYIIVLNFSSDEAILPPMLTINTTLILSTYKYFRDSSLNPWEVRIFKNTNT
jgi:oligo-1,6-glucosidase